MGNNRPRSRMVPRYQSHYVVLFMVILIGLLVTCSLQFWPSDIDSEEKLPRDLGIRSEEIPEDTVISKDSKLPAATDPSCTFHTCFDVYHCGYNDDSRISVYVYPVMKYVDTEGLPVMLPMSKEFSEVVQTVTDSIYYEADPNKSCLFLPPFDLLNQNSLRIEETSQILATLPRWNDGTNHLLFNMLPGSSPEYYTALELQRDKAMVAGAGYSSWTYRKNYDVSIPVYNPLTENLQLPEKSLMESRKYLLISAQHGLHSEYLRDIALAKEMAGERMLVVDKCKDRAYNFSQRCDKDNNMYDYPHILQDATFCLVVRGSRLGTMALSDAMMASCIPIIVADTYILPFQEVLDWKRAAIIVREDDLSQAYRVALEISSQRILEMRSQVAFFWESYFSSMRVITLNALQIINDRVFPYAARKYEEWNEPQFRPGVQSPLFLPLIPPKVAGFTAVILTYDRLESLFHIIQQVAKAPSLAKVLVVWNNQLKSPPPAATWPKINKPLKVVQTHYNKLSNRFYPYDEVETEAILALDDDILMLTTDELEFGYEVWRQFPDRLVGFPSRVHLWENATNRWRYESEWTSEISMVLTGAAYYHKHYSYLYMNTMPGNIKSWVDEHMNCEDIAMNFLISNSTGKAPIKVTPRQKFKCPECQNMTMLSADLTHMVERSECVNRFTEIYGTMPLKTVEFRADPVLYKDHFPADLKWFSNIGSL